MSDTRDKTDDEAKERFKTLRSFWRSQGVKIKKYTLVKGDPVIEGVHTCRLRAVREECPDEVFRKAPLYDYCFTCTICGNEFPFCNIEPGIYDREGNCVSPTY